MAAATSRVPAEGESIRGPRATADYAIDPETGCWLWLKFKTKAGYAGGHAHRLYWAAANGPIPDGHEIHHLCRNPACVNPAHLEAIPSRAHRQLHLSKLTLEQIEEIRELGKIPGVSAREVAARYGTTHQSVYNWWNAARRQPDFDGQVLPSGRVCANRHCDNPLIGKRRHAKFCKTKCQVDEYRWSTGIKPTPSRWRTDAPQQKEAQ